MRVHAFDHGPGESFDRAVEAGTEQGVDDDVCAIESAGIRGDGRARPLFCRQRRVTLQPGDLTNHRDTNIVAVRGEQPGRDKAIAAIVARPGNDDDAATGAKVRADRIGDGSTGPLHKADPGHTRSDGLPVGLCHFGGGQKLNHAARIAISAQIMDRRPCSDGLLAR